MGQTAGLARHRGDFFAFHDHPKRLWLKPLDPHAKERLCVPELSIRHPPRKGRQDPQPTRSLGTRLTLAEAGAARLAAWARGQRTAEIPNRLAGDVLWGEDRCRLRNQNAAWALALLRTAWLRPGLRCGWGTTPEVSERLAARPGHGPALRAPRSFP